MTVSLSTSGLFLAMGVLLSWTILIVSVLRVRSRRGIARALALVLTVVALSSIPWWYQDYKARSLRLEYTRSVETFSEKFKDTELKISGTAKFDGVLVYEVVDGDRTYLVTKIGKSWFGLGRVPEIVEEQKP